MASDYAIPLKKAWEHHSCPKAMCAAYDDDFPGQYCEGHAALLEMVEHYAKLCAEFTALATKNPRESNEEYDSVRRRLRAAVGVTNGNRNL